MALDEILQGLAVFKQNMQEVAVGSALKEANQELLNIHAQGLKDNEKLQATQALGNQLSMHLTGLGVNPAAIQTLTSRLGPSPMDDYQLQSQKDIIGINQKFTADEAEKQRKFLREMQKDKYNEMMFLSLMKGGSKQPQSVPGFNILPETQLSEKGVEDLKEAHKTALDLFSAAEEWDKTFYKPTAFGLTNVGTEYMGEDAKKMQGAQENIRVTLKELHKLGALTAPDIKMLEPLVPDATSFSAQMANGNTNAATAMRTFKKNLVQRMQNTMKKNGVEVQPDSDLDRFMGKAMLPQNIAHHYDNIADKLAPSARKGFNDALKTLNSPNANERKRAHGLIKTLLLMNNAKEKDLEAFDEEMGQ